MDPRPGTESAAVNALDVSDEETISMERIEPPGDANGLASPPTRRPHGPRWSGRPRHTREYWTTVIGAVLLLALLVGVIAAELLSRVPEITYTSVTRGNLTVSFQATGTMQTATYVAGFTSNGTIVEIDVMVGQQVHQGDTLAKLDSTALQNSFNAAQATVTAAETRLSDAQSTQEQIRAQTDATLAAAAATEQNAQRACNGIQTCLTRAESAFAAAQSTANTQNAVAQASVNDAQAQLTAAQAQLTTAQDNLNGATLKAPHDGTIAAVNGTIGSTVGVGNAPASGDFIIITDLSALQIQTRIGAGDIGTAARGNSARFIVPAFGAQVFRATIATISPAGNRDGGSLGYPAVLVVDLQSVGNARLLPGMAALVTVTTQQRFNVKLLPTSAVRFALAAGAPNRGGFLTPQQVATALTQARQMEAALLTSNVDYATDTLMPAYVLERVNDDWVIKPVVLGLTDGTSYEVLSGLSTGDTVVTGETNSAVIVPTPTSKGGLGA